MRGQLGIKGNYFISKKVFATANSNKIPHGKNLLCLISRVLMVEKPFKVWQIDNYIRKLMIYIKFKYIKFFL